MEKNIFLRNLLFTNSVFFAIMAILALKVAENISVTFFLVTTLCILNIHAYRKAK